MALSEALQARTKSKSQSTHWSLKFGRVVQFRAYCCNLDSDTIMGIAKEPVPVIDISPNPVCLGQAVSWDLSDSYAPGSTITFWSIDFGVAGGLFSGANIATASGTFTYTSPTHEPGIYDVEIVVTEGLGKSQTVIYELEVVDCTEIIVPNSWTYVATYGHGVYFIDWTDTSPAWVAKNIGLVDDDALFVNDLKIKPGTEIFNQGSHELWIATNGGVYFSKTGGATWEPAPLNEPSNAEFQLDPPATLADLKFVEIQFDKSNPDIIYAMGGLTEGSYFY